MNKLKTIDREAVSWKFLFKTKCKKLSSRGSHFVENGYLPIRFPNMVKVNIHEHWTWVTRFNPLWVSVIIKIYRDATNYGQSGLILLWLNFTSYSWTVIINSFCNTSMYLYGSANKACSCCCWIRNFNIPQSPAPYPWAFELFKARLIKFSFSPPQRPPLGIPLSPARFLFSLPSFPTIQRGLCGGKGNSPYTLRPNVVVKWLYQRRNILKIICCVEER